MMNDEMMSARNATMREMLQSAASGAFLSAVTKLGAAGVQKLSEWESPIGRKVDYAADKAEFDALRRLGIGDLPLSIGDYVALKHGDAERWNEFVRRATRQNPQTVEVLQGRALFGGDGASEGYRFTEGEEDAERRSGDTDAGKSLTNEQTNGRVNEDGEAAASLPPIKLTEPSLPKGSKPSGQYAVVRSQKEAFPLKRQNEAADFMAAHGYRVMMLQEKKNGNGYGVKPQSNPDFLIENNVFDCFSPDGANARNTWSSVKDKTESQARRILLYLIDYKGSVDQLYKQFRDWDIPTLEELLVICDGKIVRWIP